MENISEALLKELIESVLEGRSVRPEGKAGLLLEEREKERDPTQLPYMDLPPCLFFITHLSISVIPGTSREKTAADVPCGFFPAVKSLPMPKGMAYFAGFPSSVTVILRISFVLISLQISLMKVSRGFTPSSPAKRLLTETVPSSSSFCPTTSI